jgi:hypothetical protein
MSLPNPNTPARSAPAPPGPAQPVMRFSVDAWDVSYGSALNLTEEDLPASVARVDTDVEVPADQWAPIATPGDVAHPSAVLFVDGVRRVDARVWIDDPTNTTDLSQGAAGAASASMAVCASYGTGVVCCCGDERAGRQAHLIAAEIRRGLFTTAAHAVDIPTSCGTYRARHTAASDTTPLMLTLSNALQVALAEIEVITAVAARQALATDPVHGGVIPCGPDGAADDLLVIDGPLKGRAHLPRALGFIKTHRAGYLPAALNAVVAALVPGQRTPVFLMGTSWDRYAWYLRLPSTPDTPGAPWSGVVRCEAAPDLSLTQVAALANLSQAVLVRYASIAYKDSRAPQNLVPIAGLEDTLRHRLGDPRVLYRALSSAAR